jgi:aminotransferase
MFKRTCDLKLSVIKEMEILASRYPDVISLAQGIPAFDTPSCIKRRVERALGRGVAAKYSLSPGLAELRELVELSLARDNMFYDWQKEIIITAGSIEGITAAILTITKPGDEIIIPDPTYTTYREIIVLAECKPIYAPLDENNNWSFDFKKIEEVVTPKTKAILYCNPNNPTGAIYSRDELLKLAQLAEERNLHIISDEVYKDFIFEAQIYTDLGQINTDAQINKIFSLAEMPKYRKRVIRIFSFSKAYAMTGWRVGYLHGDESVIKEILKVHDCLVTCAPVISQYAAMGALEMGESDLKRFVGEFKKHRDLICARLDKLGNVFSYIKPNGAYYVFPRIITPSLYEGEGRGEVNSWQFALDLLDKIQVAVVPGSAFGPAGEGHIRLNFGRSEEDIKRAFERMEEYFKDR